MENKKEYKETWFIVPSYIADLPGMTLERLKKYEYDYRKSIEKPVDKDLQK